MSNDKKRLENAYNMILNEGLSVYIKDSGDKISHSLFDVGSKILYRYVYPYMQKAGLKSSVPDIVISDMSSETENATKGNISFYTKGIPEPDIKKIISMIKYYIPEYNSKLIGEPYEEKSKMFDSMVWRFPIKVIIPNDLDEAPEVHWSNANARVIFFDVLNYDSGTIFDYHNIDVRDLLIKIETVEDNDYTIGNAERKPEQKGNMFVCGLSKEDIKQRLDELKKMCEWAIKHHLSTIRLS